VPLIYGELRRMAAQQFRHEKPGHTLGPTALVHETYLRLFQADAGPWSNRAHFFGSAARAMRRVMIEHARARDAQKRGGGFEKVELDEGRVWVIEDPAAWLAVDQALDALEQRNKRQATIVELRVFGGLHSEEIANELGMGESTVRHEWSKAKKWLAKELCDYEITDKS
jgi:RNA polymerase sigma-70 factor, ECF subfamily